MPPMKPRYLALILLLALLLGVWLGRANLSEMTMTSSMRTYGFRDVSAEIDHLGTDHSRISQLGFLLDTDTSQFKLMANDISINYSLEQLTQGHADSLAINRLAIHHKTKPNQLTDSDAAQKALEPVKIIAALRQALREYVIFNSVSVEHLSLTGESFGVLHGKPLQLQVKNEASGIATELSLLDQSTTGTQEAIRQLLISRFSQDKLIAELVYPQASDEVPAGIELDIHDTRIEGDYFVDLRVLSDWLQPFAQINTIDGLKKITGNLSVDFGSGDKIKSIIYAQTESFNYDSYRADTVEINLKTSNPISNPLQHTKLGNGSYLNVSNFSQENLSLADTRLNIVGDLSTINDTWEFDGDINAQSITASYESRSLDLADVAATIAVNHKHLKLDGDFLTAHVPGLFSFALEHNLVDAFGRLVISPLKPIDLNAENSKLSLLWTPWPYPFDLLNGNIKLAADAVWSKNLDFTLNTRLQIDDAAGHYGEIVFAGLSFVHQLEILPTLRSVKPGNITVMQLDSGVIASNIRTSLSLDTAASGTLPRIVVQNLFGEILGGSFKGDEIVFDLNRDKNRFEIEAENIDLAEIVATQQLEDIEVTGRIDGTIPITIDKQGIFIEHGAFISDVRAGTIRYAPATGTEQLKQNPLTGIALDALRDFRYSHLSADVNFTPDGMLMVNLKLKGTSPELDTERPVHLNINTEQNLLSLLKSLRYAESVGASIDQKVRNKYKKSTSNNQDNP
jgi:hypothetical protein